MEKSVVCIMSSEEESLLAMKIRDTVAANQMIQTFLSRNYLNYEDSFGKAGVRILLSNSHQD